MRQGTVEMLLVNEELDFNYFFSSHKFHTDCLIDEVVPKLSAARRRRVEELQVELASTKKVPEDLQSVDSTKAVKVSRIDQVFLWAFLLT